MERAKDAKGYLADTVIITETRTGSAPPVEDVRQVRKNIGAPLFIGSGLTAENVQQFLPYINGCIVGSYFKVDGKWFNDIDPERVRKSANAIRKE